MLIVSQHSKGQSQAAWPPLHEQVGSKEHRGNSGQLGVTALG